jgi:hypothetical protein
MDRLLFGPEAGQRLGGIGSVRFFVRCPGNAEEILSKGKQVLRTVLEHLDGPWPSDTEWRRVLPKWFVEACAEEISREEAEKWLARWRKLPPAQQAKEEAEKAWSLSDWLYWFEDGNRQWEWWDAAVRDPDTIQVAAEVKCWPFPWGALRWLFKACGAIQVDAEE